MQTSFNVEEMAEPQIPDGGSPGAEQEPSSDVPPASEPSLTADKPDSPTMETAPSKQPTAEAKPAGPDTPQEKKAREYIAQAEKKIKSSQSFLGGLFG